MRHEVGDELKSSKDRLFCPRHASVFYIVQIAYKWDFNKTNCHMCDAVIVAEFIIKEFSNTI